MWKYPQNGRISTEQKSFMTLNSPTQNPEEPKK